MTSKHLPDPSELKIALDNRVFEIQMFWQRSNYFLVLITALGIGTFSIKDSLLAPCIAIFATTASYFWFKTNLGSKFWQESWEVEVTQLSHELGVRSFKKSTGEVREQVKESLGSSGDSDKKSYVRKWIDNLIVKKYSVTHNMILLSLWSTILWSIVAATLIVRAIANFEPEIPKDAQQSRSASTSDRNLAQSRAAVLPSKPVNENVQATNVPELKQAPHDQQKGVGANNETIGKH